jgi:hypothetical protein
MSARAHILLHQIQSLPIEDVKEFSQQFTAWFSKAAEPVAGEDDPIRSARGMFTGSCLNEALLAARAEDCNRE